MESQTPTHSEHHEHAEHALPLTHDDFFVHSDIPWHRQKFVWMIILSILAALVLTGISLRLYVTSGTAQLDLSRPGYESVRAELDQDDIQSFESTGAVNKSTITQFEKLYDSQQEKTKTNQFSSSALSNKAIGITTVPDAGQ
ncbi:MAG TPA: hypothetical protein VL362_00500 [Patescibacteria group bacterium]|nr:hypothetical protein [Patescibacteria group bacterium]